MCSDTYNFRKQPLYMYMETMLLVSRLNKVHVDVGKIHARYPKSYKHAVSG